MTIGTYRWQMRLLGTSGSRSIVKCTNADVFPLAWLLLQRNSRIYYVPVVHLLRWQGIKVQVLPGQLAVMSRFTGSGLPADAGRSTGVAAPGLGLQPRQVGIGPRAGGPVPRHVIQHKVVHRGPTCLRTLAGPGTCVLPRCITAYRDNAVSYQPWIYSLTYSTSGWGTSLNGYRRFGTWTQGQSYLHINVLEMEAVCWR